MKKLSLISIGVVGASLLASLLPNVAELLELNRGISITSAPWRLLTAHLTHWNTQHLIWDALAFAMLSLALEKGFLGLRLKRSKLFVFYTFSALLISISVYVFESGTVSYRGLSGLCVAAFALLSFKAIQRALHEHDRTLFFVGSAALLGFCAKLAVETLTLSPVFLDSQFTVSVTSHLAGLVAAFLYFTFTKDTCS